MGLVPERLPATLELAGFALLISVMIALPIGVLAAVAKGSNWDTAAKIIALLGQSLPAFWLGIVLMWIFAVMLGWLPTSGRGGLQHLILPAITLGWFQVAAIMRLVRSSMLEVLDSEFVKLDAHQGATGVEGGLEALPAQCRDRAADRSSPSSPASLSPARW